MHFGVKSLHFSLSELCAFQFSISLTVCSQQSPQQAIKDGKNVTRDTEPKGALDHLFVRIKQNATVGSYSDILRERL